MKQLNADFWHIPDFTLPLMASNSRVSFEGIEVDPMFE